MSIMMPVKYPEEFTRMGIDAPSGIMLWGPPGCGKTLLAKAIANEANINFISVKGPELLNMYVGESEKAVRTCFQRARNSQPCVIFFDEIDALCPRRSDSSEGSVSSRVVNQVLTEMDGVEGRKGVFLMAASNRPDMVDPAVLRPGRLDKIVKVGLPSAQDRIDILRAITKNGTKPPLEENVSLERIASSPECEGYSGADLAALVKEASILALTSHLSLREAAALSNDDLSNLCVSEKDFEDAMKKIKPSVHTEERKRYERLEKTFASMDR
uniref:AAA+ ATPase domain-containing protein n=3 Tax=Lygus hesperus TaxID=30085 RepID=A0A0K8T659_LYGHE